MYKKRAAGLAIGAHVRLWFMVGEGHVLGNFVDVFTSG